MTNASKETITLLRDRSRRLAEFLRMLLGGHDVPQHIINDQVKAEEDALKLYRQECAIDRN